MPVFYEIGNLHINSDHILYIEETTDDAGKVVQRVYFTTGRTMDFSGKDARKLLDFASFDIPNKGRG